MKKSIAVLIAIVLVVGALGATAYASSSQVAPSVEQKGVPKTAGDITVKLHIDQDESEQDIVCAVPGEDYDLITCAKLEGESKEHYQELANAEKISDVCSNFVETLAAINPSLSQDKAVVRDVFEFAMDEGSDAYKKLIDNAGERSFIELPFKYSLKSSQTMVVLEVIDGQWVALDQSHCVVEKGVASVRIEQPGLIAVCIISK